MTQKQKDAILMSSNRFDLGKEGGWISLTVNANVPFEYTVSENAKSWIQEVKTRGLTTSMLNFQVTANDTFSKREGEITVSSSIGSEVVKIYQESDMPTIVLGKDRYDLSCEAQEITVDVQNNVDVKMEIPSDCKWIKEFKTRSLSTNSFHLVVSENEDFVSRSCVLSFSSEEFGLKEEVVITQEPATPQLIIGEDRYEFGAEGGTISVELSSNMDVNVEIMPSCSWIETLETRAMTQRVYNFSVAKNHGRAGRNAWIVFNNESLGLADSVYVSQTFQPILVSCDTLKIPSHGGTVSFETVGTNLEDYTIVIADNWLNLMEKEIYEEHCRFFVTVQENLGGAFSRDSRILVYYKDFSEPDPIMVHQFERLHTFSFTTRTRIVTVPDIEGENQWGYVDWGDGSQEPFTPGLVHHYASSGLYTVRIEIRNKKHVSIKDLQDGMTISFRELR